MFFPYKSLVAYFTIINKRVNTRTVRNSCVILLQYYERAKLVKKSSCNCVLTETLYVLYPANLAAYLTIEDNHVNAQNAYKSCVIPSQTTKF